MPEGLWMTVLPSSISQMAFDLDGACACSHAGA